MALYAREIELVLERLNALMRRREEKGRALTQKDVAKGAGLHESEVSNFLHRKEIAAIDRIAEAIKAYVLREEAKDEGGLLKIPYVETRPSKMVVDRIKFCTIYQRMGAILGDAGCGKTEGLKEASRRDRSLIVLTAWSKLGASGILQELCEAVSVSDKGLLRACMKRLKKKLTDSGRCIVVDDAHTLPFSALDVLRYVHDQLGLGVVLIGITDMRQGLIVPSGEMEQIASRIASRLWTLPEFNVSDMRLFLHAVMKEHETDVDQAMAMIEQDPQLTASGRRLGNLLEDAARFAKKRGGSLTLDDLGRALKLASA